MPLWYLSLCLSKTSSINVLDWKGIGNCHNTSAFVSSYLTRSYCLLARSLCSTEPLLLLCLIWIRGNCSGIRILWLYFTHKIHCSLSHPYLILDLSLKWVHFCKFKWRTCCVPVAWISSRVLTDGPFYPFLWCDYILRSILAFVFVPYHGRTPVSSPFLAVGSYKLPSFSCLKSPWRWSHDLCFLQSEVLSSEWLFLLQFQCGGSNFRCEWYVPAKYKESSCVSAQGRLSLDV